MTTFERDYKDALEGDEIRVLKRRKTELENLNKEYRNSKSLRKQCLFVEIRDLKKEYQMISELF